MKPKKYRNRQKAILQPELIESDLFRGLSAKEMWVLIRFIQKSRNKPEHKKSKNYVRTNDGQIIFPYTEAIENGVSRATFDRVIKKLIQLGFIEITKQGSPYNLTPTKFAISDMWKKYGQPDFKVQVKKRVLLAGYGFQATN